MELETLKYKLVKKIKIPFNDIWKSDVLIFTSLVPDRIIWQKLQHILQNYNEYWKSEIWEKVTYLTKYWK
jgi:hypothetical protein